MSDRTTETSSLAERWRRLSEVFELVANAPEDERASLLGELCGDDDELRRHVERLLDADSRSRLFRSPTRYTPAEPEHGLEPMEPPLAVGRYRLLEPLGSGGMGTVFLAERVDGAFERSVAVKVLHGSALGFDGERRFRREGRLLAQLEHPNIARLYDAGTSDDGRPYLVMERVEGLAVDAHCNRYRLSLEARVRLFVRICRAVRFAHSHLLVHRDIKPSNVLVTAEGVPKLLDFGIAKRQSSDEVGLTSTGLLPMTPAYASPEQIRGQTVTTASDVYSLGVLLYELLTGRLPHGKKAGRYALSRAVCEEDPRPASLAALEEEGQKLAELLGIPVRELSRSLKGDLDAILCRAMSREAAERYSSVDELIADLSRYLEGHPVVARRGGRTYRALKLARRHRLPLGVMAFIAALVLGSTVTIWYQARQVAFERDRSAATTEFLAGVFTSADPDDRGRESMTATEILEDAALRASRTLTDEPEVYAKVATTLGKIFLSYGHHQEAEPLLHEAVAIYRDFASPDELATALVLLAEQRYAAGRYDEARELSAEALELGLDRLDSEHEAVIDARLLEANIAYAESHFEEAAERSAEAVESLRRSVPSTDLRLADAMAVHAQHLGALGQLDQAEAILREVLTAHRAAPGGRQSQIATTLANLGGLRLQLGDAHQAESLLRESLAAWSEIVEDDHPDVTATHVVLANALITLDQPDAAEESFRKVIAMRQRRYPPGHRRLVIPSNSLAAVLINEGRLAEAGEVLTKVLREAEQALGPDHFLVGSTACNLAEVRLRESALDLAESLFLRCSSIFGALYSEPHRTLSRPALGLGRVRLRQGLPDAAEPFLREALEIRQATMPEGHARIAEAQAELDRCLEAHPPLAHRGPLRTP